MRGKIGVVFVLALAVWVGWQAYSAAAAPVGQSGDAARGKYLVNVAGCWGCHGQNLAGYREGGGQEQPESAPYGQAFGGPAYQSLIPSLVPKEDLPNAIALNSVNINATRLIGPALGGLAIAWAGEALCFGLNAISYLAVVVQLQRIAPREAPRSATREPFVKGLAEGWCHAWRDPVVWPLVCIVGAVSFTINPYSVLMPAIAVQTFSRGAEMHGLFVTAVGAGALVGDGAAGVGST